MVLTSAVEILVKNLIKDNYSGGIPAGTSLRTSPATDQKINAPYIVVRFIMDTSRVRNTHGTGFRVNAEVWIHIGAGSKSTMQTLVDGVIAVHRLKWKAPGDGIHWIDHKGVANNDQLDRRPELYERIVKWTVVYNTT